MKKIRLLALFAAIAVILSSMQVFAFAAETETTENTYTCPCGIVYHFEEGVSEEVKERVVAGICDEMEDDGVQTASVLCDLFGHNLDVNYTYGYKHKAYTSAPRCIKYTYQYDICTRCDYAYEYLIKTEKIYCCD